MVKLPQFESLGGLSVTLKTLEVKVKIGGYFRRVKCNFPKSYIGMLYFPKVFSKFAPQMTCHNLMR
jgi:hypothetical protein